ncbi:unnamed protein product (macronuclear) [Paramecium tetraurelia]|uniref:Uncharacterized protein n=1 Tax=Paramecium tetraurelia TaxID=5888 RepID=A0CTL9_PARTE|nr:uncharacterized protein GSPATT00010370001 [Paramecium tetraurelia]CAK74136.1 unnamed protein product [Paramecium tetraurelia]|eukprot:XP_001441533.1 hypothetical protein (macronuclear) [Paramecium tetraurelia strain d4-2]
MSEVQQLEQQKVSIEQNQEMLSNWISLKKILSSKFKSAQDAFKALKKEGCQILTIEDFQEYSKGLDLSLLFKDVELNEGNFGKVWENWEYKQKQNEHKLQIINEKLKLLSMFENKDQNNEAKADVISNKSIQKLISNCESLDQLQEKLDLLVEEGQKQKNKSDVFQNETDCFSIYQSKKNEQQPEELYISKLQLKFNEGAEGNLQTIKKNIKSYIEGQHHHFRNQTELSNGTLLQSALLNKASLMTNPKPYE